MGSRRARIPVRGASVAVAALLTLASAIATGCGPSEEEVRADIDAVCVAMVEDLSELDARPAFASLAAAAGEAGFEFGAAAYRVEDISTKSPADELTSALHAVDDAYSDLERQLNRRDYASLAQTRVAGEAALADALAAAAAMGATDCMAIDARAEYFAIAADGAAAAAASIAPTGDYVVDVNAACARYDDDTYAVFLKLAMRSAVGEYVDLTVDARDYLEMLEDARVITTALEVLVGELERLVPPTDAVAAHAQLIEGYQGAIEAIRALQDGGEADGLTVSTERVRDAAERLGVDCSL